MTTEAQAIMQTYRVGSWVEYRTTPSKHATKATGQIVGFVEVVQNNFERTRTMCADVRVWKGGANVPLAQIIGPWDVVAFCRKQNIKEYFNPMTGEMIAVRNTSRRARCFEDREAMTDQKAARNDLADARRTIAELREDLDRTQTYMMNKTDEYSASLDRYRDELALCRETIRRLVVAFRVTWLVAVGLGVYLGEKPKRLVDEIRWSIKHAEEL